MDVFRDFRTSNQSLVIYLYNLCLWQFLITDINARDDSLGEVEESLTRHAVSIEGRRLTGITTVADPLHERYLSEQRHIHLLGEILAAVLAGGREAPWA